MELQAYIDEIKTKLTGGVVELDITDDTLSKVITSALREIQRYIDTTNLVTVPFKECIDLTEYKVSSVSRVFRTAGYYGAQGTSAQDEISGTYNNDPMYLGLWQSLAGGNLIHSTSNWAYNYASWNTMLQTRNTLSTDLQFRFDKNTNLLYINTLDTPDKITIEYIPVYDEVSEIKSDYWIDMLINLSVALTKVTIGRIRKKFSQSNALWSLDTDILTEGQAELDALREQMRANNQLVYGID